jgi:hypothetical protein
MRTLVNRRIGMHKGVLIVILVIALVGGAAYFAVANLPAEIRNDTNQSPITSGENPEPGSSVHDLPVEPAAASARKDLAARLSVDEKSIVIMQITDTTWNNGCLGLAKADEFCTQALVQGFKVEMLAQGKTYFYRTDKTGANLRAETQ